MTNNLRLLYLDRDRYSKDNVYKNMLNDEFTELLKDAKEVEKKTPKGKQNTHSSSS